MAPYDPSFTRDLYRERLAEAEADRIARLLPKHPESKVERESHREGVNGLLLWSEAQAMIRRFA